MARYRIEESEKAVIVDVTEVGGKQEKLLDAFSACQAGQCSCPTDEYEKLAAMEVQRGEDDIQLRLEPKPGEKFDVSEIAACLDYTTAKATEAED